MKRLIPLNSEQKYLLKLLLKDWKYIRFPTLNFVPFGVKEMASTVAHSETKLDLEFLRRVQICFQASSEASPFHEDKSIWKKLFGKNTSFVSALLSDNPSELRPFASNLYSGSTMYGMAHTQEFIVGADTIYPKKYFSMRVRDSIISLATAIGVLNITSNQQTSLKKYVKHINQDLGPLIQEIEELLGIKLDTPIVGSPPVVEIGSRLFNPDTIRHAYVPYRIGQLVDLRNAKVLEVGGGYGCVARYSVLSGCNDWTIIDLPYVNAIQMIWLGSTLGPEMVSGYGEQAAPIKLVPSTKKDLLREQKFTIALNMDSLPEIPYEEAKEYADLISRTSELLLSINQEAQKLNKEGVRQHSVHRLFADRSLKLKGRHPYWMEQGYAEEIYQAT